MKSTPFDQHALDRLATQFRAEEAADAVSTIQSAAGDLSREPHLSFKTFTVGSVLAAVSPDCSYRLLVGALSEAKHSITAYVYNIGAPYLLELLKRKLALGVTVRVMVDPNDPNDQKSKEWEHLQALPGIDLRLAPSSGSRRVFTVCHQKYVVVDGKTVVVESANWAVSSIPVVKHSGEYQPGNREWLIRVDDKDVAAWFTHLFQLDWDIPEQPDVALAEPALSVGTHLEAVATFSPPGKLFDIASAASPVTLLPVVSPGNYLAEVGKALRRAKKRISIQQQYILAGKGVNDLLKIVHEKATSCEIRIIVSPKFAKGWQSSVDTLNAAGLGKFLRAQNLQHVIHCHNKGVIIDDDHVVVSSTNWSENSILRARETGFLVGSKEIAGYFRSVFDLDWKEGLLPAKVATQMIPVAASEMV
jgi:phosphatidylserine/phosphatidylglycerophosphate/cardiolipin synthase-like enzyme